MKLPWQHNKPHQDEGKTAVKPSDKATVARLKASGDEGTLVLSTDNLVKKYRQRTGTMWISLPCRFTVAPSWAWVTCRRRHRCSAP